MTKNLKISIGLIVIAIAVLATVVALTSKGDDGDVSTGPAEARSDFAPDNSIRLATAPSGAPVLVEFLDFECEGCRAAKPLIDDIAQRFDGRLEIVIRHMPLHASSVNAAKAAEAAEAQGEFKAMYDLLYETQPQWGEQQTAAEQVFFDMAEQLGLDMAEFRSVYDDPETAAKIERDARAGTTAGVTGTPTFFLEGEMLDVGSADDLVMAIEDAVGG